MNTLGIDLGTTSVKVVLVSRKGDRNEVLASASLRHSADVVACERYEQNPTLICEAVERCLCLLKNEVGHTAIAKTTKISICGQMHGCMLWNPDAMHDKDLFYFPSSNLVTWQDQRCLTEFLSSLPQAENCVPVSTGFGCATLFWMQRHDPHFIKKYKCTGTIMDYLTSCLCGSTVPTMSTHNAMSWGYYDFCSEQWNVRILEEHGFPTTLLPKIVGPGTVIGTLKHEWCGIQQGTEVLAGLGDMQCSVLSCEPEPLAGVFNLSTSAQLSATSALLDGKDHYNRMNLDSNLGLPDSVICVPYFGELCLWTSASLNGGAVFEMYCKALHEWTKNFVPDITIDDIYRQIQKEHHNDVKDSKSSMRIYPTVYGERHAPDLKASIENIGSGDVSLATISIELCRGIIRNVFVMFSKGSESQSFGNVSAIWGCGTAFDKNVLFRNALEEISKLPCRFDKSIDAAYGAATAAIKYSN